MPRDENQRTENDRLESDLVSVLNRTRANIVVDQDRRQGMSPWRVETIGEFKMLWGTTGRISSGAAKTVYLTESKEPRGAGIFRNEPLWSVTIDAINDIGGAVAASGPDRPGGRFGSRHDNTVDYVADLAWNPANEVFSITVTNNTGTAADFFLKCQGV